MTAEERKTWVDALKSGNYKQGKQSLKDEDKFCCLGVLCDLNKKHGGEWEGTVFNYKGSYQTAIVPDNLAKELDIRVAGAIYINSLPDNLKKDVLKTINNFADDLEKTVLLSHLNDRGMSFEKIAEIIEVAEFQAYDN